jgi:hypothetical protein
MMTEPTIFEHLGRPLLCTVSPMRSIAVASSIRF